MLRAFKPFVRTGLVFLLSVGALTGQANNSYRISGKVTVSDAQFAPNLIIELVRDAAQVVRTTLPDVQGRYAFSGLPAGTYFVRLNVPGPLPISKQVILDQITPHQIVDMSVDTKRPERSTPKVDFSGEETQTVSVEDLQHRTREVLAKYEHADREMNEGKTDGAISLLEAVIQEDPGFYDARKSLGTVYQRVGRYGDAQEQFEAARELRPDSAAPWLSLGSLYVQESDGQKRGSPQERETLSKALDTLEQATHLNPDASFAYYLLGVAYYKSEFYEDAEENLLRALALEPRLGHAHLALANVYIQIQEWSGALNEIETYLQQNPDAGDHEQVGAMRSNIRRLLGESTSN